MDETGTEERRLIPVVVDAETLGAWLEMASEHRRRGIPVSAQNAQIRVSEASPSILASLASEPIFLVAAFAYGVIVGLTIYGAINR